VDPKGEGNSEQHDDVDKSTMAQQEKSNSETTDAGDEGGGGDGDGELEVRRTKAITRCDTQIEWYKNSGRRARLGYRLTQPLVIILSVVTPVLLLIDSVPIPALNTSVTDAGLTMSISAISWVTMPEAVQAIPPLLVTVLVAVNAFFNWRESWIRRSATAELLKSEKVKYETQTGPDYGSTPDGQEALEHFVLKIESIASSEIAEWRAQALASQKKYEDELDELNRRRNDQSDS